MRPLGIVGENIEQEVYGIAVMQERYGLLLSLRRRARQALDRVLAAPRTAAAYIGRLTHNRLVRRLLAAGAAALHWLAPVGRFVRSIGLAPVALAVAASPTAQRLAAQAVAGMGRLITRAAQGVMRAVYGLLRAFGPRGDRMAAAVSKTVTKTAQAVRSAVAPILPRLYVGVGALAVALEVTRPLVRGLLVHRTLVRLIPSRLVRAVTELLVTPVLVDGRVGRWFSSAVGRVLQFFRCTVLRRPNLVVVEQKVAEESAVDQVERLDLQSTETVASTRAEAPSTVPPNNRAERREAQRQQALARRQTRTA